jgi:hypothetical protein
MGKKNKAKKPKPHGRPTKFTQEIARHICEQLAKGKSLRRICAESEDFPHESTVRLWVVDDVQGFYTQYVRARDIGLDAMADEMLDIADDGENDYVERERKDGSVFIALDREAVARSGLRVDTRKWYLSKLAPKRYDRPQTDTKEDAPEIGEDYTATLKIDEDAPPKPVL